MSMKRSILAALAALVSITPAWALGPEDPNEVGGFLAHLRGDELTEATPPPVLDDDIAFGAYYVRYFSDRWSAMGRLSFAGADVENLAGGASVGMDVTFIDVSLAYQWNWPNFSLAVPFGLSYSQGSLDRALLAPDGVTVVGDDSDLGYHLGFGVIWPLRDSVILRFEGRYRIAGELLDTFADTADVYETSLAVGYTF
jgi:opacity protein-like surface antigen